MAREVFNSFGDKSFSLVTYGHDEGFDLLLLLAKIGLPSVFDVIRENPSIEALAAAFEAGGGVEGLLQSIHLMPGRIQAEGGSALLSRFFSGVFAVEQSGEKPSKPIKRRLSDSNVRSDVFGLNFTLTFRVLAWVIQENFGPFLSELGEVLEAHSPKREQPAQESETSEEPQ